MLKQKSKYKNLKKMTISKDELDYYCELFGIPNWTVDILFDASLKQNAMTLADPRYNRATITINPETFTEKNRQNILIHEFIHIIMSLYDYFADNLGKEGTDDLFFIARENAVSQLTKIFLRILEGGKTNEK